MDLVSQFGARFLRFPPPVKYGPNRLWFQRVRAGAAAVILAACGIGALTGLPYVYIPAGSALAVLVHALTRGRVAHGVLETLLVDAAAIAVGASAGGPARLSLVAAAAYLIATAITFGGMRSLLVTMAFYGLALAAVRIAPTPAIPDLPGPGVFIVWLVVGLFLGAVAITLMSAASAVHRAARRHDEALDSERRASEMKNEFVSMITHELRTPLTNIAGFAMTLQETWNQLDPAETEEFLRIIVTEAEHLGNLVEDVLAIPRLEAGRLLLETTEFALQPAAYRIADLVFPAGGDRSASVSIGGSVWVNADPNRIEQVFRNLLENARKYGGTEVWVEATRKGEDWLITVADNGPGVPADHRDRVFGAFEQVGNDQARTGTGFGLGLAVAKHLVEAMGGKIWYEPGFPVGARFCFTIPAAEAPAAPVIDAVA
jgi:signal transduction histidine kinase